MAFGIQSQIIRHIKEAQNTACIREKNQSIEVGLEITQMIELVDNDIARVTLFQMFKKLKERLSMLSRNMEDIK